MPRNLVTSFCAKQMDARVNAKLKNSSLFMFQHIMSFAPQEQFVKEAWCRIPLLCLRVVRKTL